MKNPSGKLTPKKSGVPALGELTFVLVFSTPEGSVGTPRFLEAL